jgi:3-oxoacyl-[acyl-carrier protein] reductase
MTAGRTLPSSLDLTGRRAIVTGASRGIGRAIAETLATRGATVVVNYRAGEAAAREVCDAIAAAGGTAHAIGFDVADAAAVEAGMKAAIDALGGLEILVNNAGISIDALIMRAAAADFDATMATNLRGAFLCSKIAARHLLKAKERGRIVNLSSVVGEQGNPGQSMYAASKAGVIGLTKSLARELAGRGITVNAVTPGYIATDMTAAALTGDAQAQLLSRIPLGRVGQPQEIAEAVAFLSSDAAAYVTGHVMRVNGGLAI